MATALARRYRAIAEADSHSELEVTIGEARQIYPEMWRHLDEARIALGERGVDCTAYDNLRRQELGTIGVDVGMTVGVEFYTYGLKVGEIYKKTASFDADGAHRAIAAIAILRQLMPEVDWAARARAEDQLIREVGSLKSSTWIGLAKLAGAAAAIAIVALVIFHFLSDKGSEIENAPRPVTAPVVETPKPVGPPDPVPLAVRAQCQKARQTITERIAKEHDLVRGPQWSMNCEGILIDNQPVAFAVSVHAPSRGGALIELRGVVSLNGMRDLRPFLPVPAATALAFVGDLDGDTNDELVFVGPQSLVVTRITKDGFVDIAGPAMPTGCAADAKVTGDYRNGRPNERNILVLTAPDDQVGSGCLSAGKHYFRLAGDHLEET
ncbi:MAG TPA: hypothetical protein VMZ53_15030 [Kofleriaceae bacterium]|nr:hypothetical protein [Kofleriaceae bacterium]